MSAAGKTLEDWPDERWLDVRALRTLGPVLKRRLDLCARKGFDGVEADNVDAYANDSGFPLRAAHQLRFNRFLARAAHARGLAIALKNDVDQADELADDFDWALVEECFEYDECERLRPFTAAGKAVWAVEYTARARRLLSRRASGRFHGDGQAPRARRGAGAVLVSVRRRPASSVVPARQPSRCAATAASRQERCTSPARAGSKRVRRPSSRARSSTLVSRPVPMLQWPSPSSSPAAQEGVDDVGDVDEVARLAAVAEDRDRLARRRRGAEDRDHARLAARPGAGRRRWPGAARTWTARAAAGSSAT